MAIPYVYPGEMNIGNDIAVALANSATKVVVATNGGTRRITITIIYIFIYVYFYNGLSSCNLTNQLSIYLPSYVQIIIDRIC